MVLEMYHKNFNYLPWLESIEVARPNNWYFWLYVEKWGYFEPLCLGNESTFLKIKKKLFLVYGVRNITEKYQTSAINRK